MNLKPHQSALLGAIVVAAVASLIPVVQLFLLPLTYLNTHLHEFCHAIVAVITGGSVKDIEVFASGAGVTPVAGGFLPLIASAGYMGATIMGAAIILLGSTPVKSKRVMGFLAGLLGVSMVIWVRGDMVGELSGLFWIAALALSAIYLRGNAALFVCQFIGVEQCLNSVTSVYQLLRISFSGEQVSDASIMHSATMIPDTFWAFAWCSFSLIVLGATVRKGWKSHQPTPQA
jgi:hypothetical protein